MIALTDDEFDKLRSAAFKAHEIVKAVEHISHILNVARKKNPYCMEIVEALGLHQGLLNEAKRDIREINELMICIQRKAVK